MTKKEFREGYFSDLEESIEQMVDQRNVKAEIVLQEVVREGAPIFMRYMRRKDVPPTDILRRLTEKLIAIDLATIQPLG